MWMTALFGLLPGLANTLAAWVTARGNDQLATIGADKDVALSQLTAITAANNAKAAVIQLPWVKWIMLAMYLPVVAHLTGVVLGRMHLIDFDMLALDSLEQTVLMSLVIYVPASKWVSR